MPVARAAAFPLSFCLPRFFLGVIHSRRVFDTWPCHLFSACVAPWAVHGCHASKKLVHSKKSVWASQWLVTLCTFYRQILSLAYIIVFYFRHRLARLYILVFYYLDTSPHTRSHPEKKNMELRVSIHLLLNSYSLPSTSSQNVLGIGSMGLHISPTGGWKPMAIGKYEKLASTR